MRNRLQKKERKSSALTAKTISPILAQWSLRTSPKRESLATHPDCDWSHPACRQSHRWLWVTESHVKICLEAWEWKSKSRRMAAWLRTRYLLSRAPRLLNMPKYRTTVPKLHKIMQILSCHGRKITKNIWEILKKLQKKRSKSYQKNFGDRRRYLARDANVEINCEQPNLTDAEFWLELLGCTWILNSYFVSNSYFQWI